MITSYAYIHTQENHNKPCPADLAEFNNVKKIYKELDMQSRKIRQTILIKEEIKELSYPQEVAHPKTETNQWKSQPL